MNNNDNQQVLDQVQYWKRNNLMKLLKIKGKNRSKIIEKKTDRNIKIVQRNL